MTPQLNSTQDLLLRGWEIHPSVIVGCLAVLAWYHAVSPRNARYTLSFSLGVLVLTLALISPIDPLGDQYLFSAHMLQHLLLILVVPPLLILGLPPELVLRWMRNPTAHHTAAILSRPTVAWSSNMLMMAVWHIPALYNAANAIVAVHIFEHLTFLVTGCMFWWPIFTPITQERMQPGRALIYLFGAAVVSTILGILITFLPVGHYEPYLHPDDELGALHLIRDVWNVSPVEDEKLAGLLMWVPGCGIYFAVMLLELARWYQTPDPDKQRVLASLRDSRGEARHG